MEYNIPPSSPHSISSSTSSGSSPSRDVSLRLPSNDELKQEGIDSIIERLRHVENDHKKLLIERSRSMKEVNKKLQVHLLEVRGVREVNQRLMQEKESLLKEKEELAGICCFLDDDREKAKRVAREWQMFGRYCTGVLQKELSACQAQIRELEQKQFILTQENKNLKELCLMLDNEQAGSRSSVDSQSSIPGPQSGLLTVAGTRDSGDGSSNGSTTSNCSPDHRQTSSTSVKDNLYSSDPSHGESYLRYLEHKVRHLEEEAKGKVKRITVPPPTSANLPPPPPNHGFGSPRKLERKFFSSSVLPTSSQASENNSMGYGRSPAPNYLSGSQSVVPSPPSSLSSVQKPVAIMHALKVLELHDRLDQDEGGQAKFPHTSELDEKEREMLREMCNVVWRKLGNKVVNGKTAVPRTASVSDL